MPQPGEVFQQQPSSEDSFLDLLVETLEGLDESARGQFLRQFFRTIVQIDFTETQSYDYWERILQRRRELSENSGRRASLKAAMMDVFTSANLLRVPILMEYEEFRKLRINAATDPLTGLYNRRLFDEYCDKELNRARRYGQNLALVILDLHKLKQVNDRHGHLAGDKVLRMAASTLRHTLRASDFAFRIGGDEFALLLPETEPEQAVTLCRRLRAQYEGEVRPMELGIPVTLDFGVAVHPVDGSEKSQLMSLADERLYELKHEGRIAGTRPEQAASQIQSETRRWTNDSAASATAIPEAPGAEAPHAYSAGPESPGETKTAPVLVPVAVPPPTEVPAAQGAPSPNVYGEPRRVLVERRKWERVSLADTKAHAVLTELGDRGAKVLDLSYGGVALVVDKSGDLPEQYNAVLNVPILPPVRVLLRKIYVLAAKDGLMRVGCAFVS
jgi:diguanylate cyclase (GGDEF)-like protein